MTNKKLKVGVIFGGRSGEHEVSLVSGSSVMNALDKEKYEVVPIGITKEGRWIAGPDSVKLLKSGEIPPALKALLPADPTSKELTISEGKEVTMQKQALDVIIPILHGPYGEDGTIQGLLEMAGIPFVGCSVLGSAVCMDKVIQKQVCQSEGIPSVKYKHLKKKAWGPNDVEAIEKELGYPLFVKPANLGSSIGINKAHNKEELEEAIEEAFVYDTKIIIEAAVENVREFELSVLGNDNPKVSTVGELVPSNEFYDYDAKYVDGKTDLFIPAKIGEELQTKMQEYARKAFLATECKGMARIDFLYNDETGDVYLNEINTIPGFTEISMYPKLWEASGIAYKDLLDELIQLAVERHKERSDLKTSYTPKEDWYK